MAYRERMEHVVVATNPSGRLRIIGPFASQEEAEDWSEDNVPLALLEGQVALEHPDDATWHLSPVSG